ncbi:MAG: M28 family peptidase [Gemmatimonadetes bacterium]|nr:M28 family peptidase [Gemmatimonadota bacterium]
MRKLRGTLTLSALVWMGACKAGAPGVAAAPAPTSIEPNAAELRSDLFAFAADSFRGRETGTPDADRAAAWIARRLATLGLEPAGDSGYFHRVPMRRTALAADSIVVTTPSGRTSWRLGRDLLMLTALGPGAPLPKLSTDAEVVFASYGLIDPALGRDDYKGLDVKGKVVVIAGAIPPGVDAAKRKALENPDALFSRLGGAIGRGPAAIVLLLSDSLFELASGQFSDRQVELARGPAPANAARPLPMVAVGRLTSGSPLVPAGWPSADQSTVLAGTRLTASVRQRSEDFNGYNVVGIVRGTDPALRNTYVAYGAHYDHIGIQPAVNGDSIANGADDDGSGSVLQLSLARAFAQGPKPKRSLLFVWHVGEEKGLFGSDVFTTSPTVPLDSIVAQLNADMVGRNGDDSLYIVGPGAAPNGQSATLGAVIDSVNATTARPFAFNREWDTTTHPERIYFRSDHFNYARKGIPIVFFTTGLHPQYHQVTDEAGLINYPKMERIGNLMYRAGFALGDRPTRPKPTATQ